MIYEILKNSVLSASKNLYVGDFIELNKESTEAKILLAYEIIKPYKMPEEIFELSTKEKLATNISNFMQKKEEKIDTPIENPSITSPTKTKSRYSKKGKKK